MTNPSLASAQAALSAAGRINWHSDTESTNDIDAIMATITPKDTLTWTPTWAWSAPVVHEDGTIKVAINTAWDGILGFYEMNRKRYQVADSGLEYLRIASDWYSMRESLAHFQSVSDGDMYAQAWTLLGPVDGEHGITGEIAWGEFPQLSPPSTFTYDDRARLHDRYLSALREQDTDAVLDLMPNDAQGAVRDYAGEQAFVQIDGKEQMEDHYRRFFESVRVHSVDPIRLASRDWYIFSELSWQVEFVAGPRKGERGALLTAENLPLCSDGRLFGRMGYGTDLLTTD